MVFADICEIGFFPGGDVGKQIFASESQISAIEALTCLERAPFLDIWKEEGEREFPSRIEILEILRTILSILARDCGKHPTLALSSAVA